ITPKSARWDRLGLRQHPRTMHPRTSNLEIGHTTVVTSKKWAMASRRYSIAGFRPNRDRLQGCSTQRDKFPGHPVTG
ncbi:hypothetical protein RUND412_004021, partial [Rhizina undulata]